MRILLANTGHPAQIKGGAEAAVVDLGRELVARGHSVALAVHHAGPELSLRDDDGLRVYSIPHGNLYFAFDGRRRPAPLRFVWHALDSANPFTAASFRRVLEREQPDVVNTHVVTGLSQLIWRESRRRQVAVVHYLHEYGTMCPRGSAFANGRLCRSACASCKVIAAPRRRLSRFVDTVVGVSRFTLERHVSWRLFPNAERLVIPNVFRDLAWVPAPRANDDNLRLGYFGRLIPDKGPELLLAALARLPPAGWTLDIAGAGDPTYIDALRAAAPPNVRFLGWTPPNAFFEHVDLLVVPSLWPDPQPRVVFESYAKGVPVAGSRVGGIPEQIDEGRTGWLFEPSAEALAGLLQQRMHDRADRRMQPSSFRERLARLEPTRVVAEYEAAFRGAIERRDTLKFVEPLARPA